jgi:hypothetical protein
MKDKEFDKIIRDRLSQLSPAYQPESWASFAERLDELDKAELREIEASDQVRKKMSQLSPPFQSAHWAQLVARMEAQKQLNRRILFSKGMESILLLLFLIGLCRFAEIPTSPVATASDLRERTTSDVFLQKGQDGEKETIIHPELSESALSESEGPGSYEAFLSDEGGNIPPTDGFKKGKAEKISPVASVAFVATDYDRVIDQAPILPGKEFVITAGMVQPEWVLPFDVAFVSSEGTSSSLLEKRVLEIESKPELLSLSPALTSLAPIRPAGHNGLFVNGFVSGDYNVIMTPYDEDFFEEAYMQGTYSYGSGFSLAKKTGRWEWSLGAVYHNIIYQPKRLIEIFDGSVSQGGYYADELEQIELNTLQVPLSLRSHIVNREKFQLFVSGGMGLRIALQTYYDFNRRFVALPQANPSSQGAPGTGFPPRNNQADGDSRLSQRAQSSGVLEGGNFQRNHYFTASLGAGFVYWTSPRYGFFCESLYNHQLFVKEIGPNRDRINTFSLQLGFRARLHR